MRHLFSRQRRAMLAAIAADDEKFTTWLRRNPGGKRSDYYVETVMTKIDAKRSHQTLGGNLSSGLPFQESGLETYRMLLEGGLLPTHTCVDYGCGSLRIGQHIIRSSEPGCYWGLDVTDQFFRMGLELIGPEIVAAKQPCVQVITPETLAAVRDAEPNVVFSHAVLSHVPPEEIDEFLADFMSIFCDATVAYVSVKLSKRPSRISARSWTYPESFLAQRIEALGGRVTDARKLPKKASVSWRLPVYPAWLTVTLR